MFSFSYNELWDNWNNPWNEVHNYSKSLFYRTPIQEAITFIYNFELYNFTEDINTSTGILYEAYVMFNYYLVKKISYIKVTSVLGCKVQIVSKYFVMKDVTIYFLLWYPCDINKFVKKVGISH